MNAPWLATWTLAQRELVRFYRQRSRVIGALAPPILFWGLIGAGLGGSFHAGGAAMGAAPAVGENSLQYLFPGTVMLIVLFTSIFSTISLIEDRREGFLQAVLVAPVPRLGIVLGKLLGGATLGWLQGVMFLALAPTVGATATPGSLAWLLGFLWLSALGLTGLGFVFAWQIDSVQGFHAIMNLVLMPLWLLSGALFPATGAPTWLQWTMRLNPVTYGVEALRHGCFPALHSGPSLALCVVVTTCFAALTTAASAWVASRRAAPAS